MNKQIKILNQETVYNGFFRLDLFTLQHSLYAGGLSAPLKREVFRRGQCVAVLLYDPNRDEVVLIEQFRIGAYKDNEQAWLLEIVAGAVEDGESVAEVAHRESLEEAGCLISNLFEVMQFYTTPGGCSERITLFCAQVDSSLITGIHGLTEEGEDILVKTVKVDQVAKMLEQGKFVSAIPILALQWLITHRQQLQQQWCDETR